MPLYDRLTETCSCCRPTFNWSCTQDARFSRQTLSSTGKSLMVPSRVRYVSKRLKGFLHCGQLQSSRSSAHCRMHLAAAQLRSDQCVRPNADCGAVQKQKWWHCLMSIAIVTITRMEIVKKQDGQRQRTTICMLTPLYVGCACKLYLLQANCAGHVISTKAALHRETGWCFACFDSWNRLPSRCL